MAPTFNDGDRVQHDTWTNGIGEPLTGRVRLFPDAEPGTVTGEVCWDGSFVADELALVEDNITAIDTRRGT